MKSLFRYASLLAAAAMLAVTCGDPVDPQTPDGPDTPGTPDEPQVSGTLSLSVDRQIIQSNGTDAATFIVSLDDKVLTEDVIFHDSRNNDAVIEIQDFKFTTSEAGEYGIWAEYMTIMSNEVKITAVVSEVPETPADPQPSNTSLPEAPLVSKLRTSVP